jgi:5-(carboxyamino)imidazole ribonucleotide synthase
MIPNIKIGIIGGGQLGKMMTQAAKKMGFYVQILDPTPNCPAGQVADKQIIGSFYDKNKIKDLVLRSDITTYDIEHIDTEILKKLFEKGHLIYPSPQILEIIQDKSKQKEVLEKAGIPIARYKKIENHKALISDLKEFNLPVVQKACKEGYDGRGVFIIKNRADIKKAIKAESFLEEFVDLEKELAINVARDKDDKIKCYSVVEMIFNKRANICDMIITPARVSENIKKEVEEIGIRTVRALGDGAVGIFGIEMFLTKEGRILVNEIAPRPHNSGHYTIEACITSQFEQHIRAITGLPLGSTELVRPAVMVNILGEEGYEGPAVFEGVREVLEISGLSLYIYGKQETRAFRKMGHLTVIDKDIKRAIKKAKRAKKLIRVIAE